jgi:hypothetical protein
MGVAKPTGGYAEPMLDPGGWPDVDEQVFYDRALQYTQVLHRVAGVLSTCQRQRAEIFDGGIWSGGAAGAANGQLDTLIGEMTTLQNGLATVITWHKYVALTIVGAKSDVTDNVVQAHRTIDALENDPGLDAAELTEQINAVVTTAHGANVQIVEGTAAQVLVSKSWRPPANALQDLLDQKTPPPVTMPDTPAVQPSPDPLPKPAQPVPVTPGTGGPTPPVTPGTGGPTPPTGTPGTGGPTPPTGTPPADGGGLQPTPGTPAKPGQPAVPTLPNPAGPSPAVPGGGPGVPLTPAAPAGPSPAVPGGGPGVPLAPAAPAGPSPAVPGGGPGVPLAPPTPAAPLSPAAGAQQPGTGGGGGKGVTPAAASAGVSPASTKPVEESSAGAPAGATGMPAGPMGSGGSSGARAGSGAKSGAPVGQQPADKSPSTRPAASTSSAGKSKPRPQPVHVEHAEVEQSAVVAPAPVIPVSAARAERDAIAEAATADAARRAGPDPLQLARRVGAALNAPDVGGGMDIGFFWVTGLTTDGAIVVANSYGLAYIPEGVRLPEKVYLASGDETIPVAARARWATYPVVAVRGWADHHDKKLRAVIGTEQQLANSDPGVATVVLKPDDIPDTGDMTGRSRLEVVDSEAADRLAATADARLVDLLPPAPAAAEPAPDRQPAPPEVVDPEAAAVLTSPSSGTAGLEQLLAQMPSPPADANSPADDRLILWFEVMKPLASSASGRQAAHLRAFQAYAACAEEVVLREAHTAADSVAQRSAVADWLYWKHLTALLDAALADPRILSPA